MARIIETATGAVERVDVDPVTLDLIENGLRNARYEMDEVLFRTALSPGIREQHDEFPLIADPDGKMVVGQFGLSIPDVGGKPPSPTPPGPRTTCEGGVVAPRFRLYAKGRLNDDARGFVLNQVR